MDQLSICYDTITGWINNNYEWLYIIITTILTTLLIRQNGKLSKQQQVYQEKSNQQQQEFQQKLTQQQLDFQQKIHDRDVEMQKRQLKVDTYPYKREIYRHILSIFKLCEDFQWFFNNDQVYKRSTDNISKIWETSRTRYIPDVNETFMKLQEAIYVLPPECSQLIGNIEDNFISLITQFNGFAIIFINENYSDTPNEPDFFKRKTLDTIKELCENTLQNREMLEQFLVKELNIGTINQ